MVNPDLLGPALGLLQLLFPLVALLVETFQQVHLLAAPAPLADLQLLGQVHDCCVRLGQQVLVLSVLPLQRPLQVWRVLVGGHCCQERPGLP